MVASPDDKYLKILCMWQKSMQIYYTYELSLYLHFPKVTSLHGFVMQYREKGLGCSPEPGVKYGTAAHQPWDLE